MVLVVSLLMRYWRRASGLRNTKQRVTRKMLMNEAAWLYRVRNEDGRFMASEGWLRRFLLRKITMHRRTTISQ